MKHGRVDWAWGGIGGGRDGSRRHGVSGWGKWGAILVVVLLTVVGCARVPEQEIQDARTALQTAEEAGADTYAPESLSRARTALGGMEAELEQQRGRFFLSRSYDRVRTLAGEALAAAREGQTRAAEEKTRLRSEVMTMIRDARTSLESALARLRGAPTRLQQSLQPKLDGAGRQINSAQSAVDAQRYDEAMRDAAAARDAVRAVLRELERISPQPPSRKR